MYLKVSIIVNDIQRDKVKVKKKHISRRFKKGRASRLAIIVKVKDDGTKKRRLIVDLKRSGRNALAYVAERVVPPRLGDAVFMMLLMLRMLTDPLVNPAMAACHAASDFGVELVSGDFSGAYYHFRIHESEWEHCLSPDVLQDSMLLWIHMCFGLVAAPLIWCRLAAAIARGLGMEVPVAAARGEQGGAQDRV